MLLPSLSPNMDSSAPNRTDAHPNRPPVSLEGALRALTPRRFPYSQPSSAAGQAESPRVLAPLPSPFLGTTACDREATVGIGTLCQFPAPLLARTGSMAYFAGTGWTTA